MDGEPLKKRSPRREEGRQKNPQKKGPLEEGVVVWGENSPRYSRFELPATPSVNCGVEKMERERGGVAR